MFWRITWFEISYWLRSKMLWVFFGVIALMVFAAVSTPNVQLFIVLTNTYHNAPFVISGYYGFISLVMLLMAAAFVNSAALRDFRFNTNQIVFSTPMRRRDYLFGRFIGATLVSTIPMLGVSAGILAAKYMPWADPDQWGRVNWAAHLHAIYVFALPNALIIAAILFAIAVMARNEVIPFIGALVLLIGYIAAGVLLQDLRHEDYVVFADPFGIRTFALIAKYWTVADKNSIPVALSGLMLWNRLLWAAIAAAIFAFAYFRFSFSEKASKAKPVEADSQAQPVAVGRPIPSPNLRPDAWQQLIQSLGIHLRGMLVSIPFIIIMLAGGLNCLLGLMFNATEGYGNHTLPVTFWVLDLIRGTLYLFVIVVVTFYAGALVWKDKDERMDEIVDAAPVPEWISYATRLVTLIVMVMLIQVFALLSGIAVQAWHGYYRFQIGLYSYELLVRDLLLFVALAVLAFFIHAVSPNKYLGYAIYIAFLTANVFMWRTDERGHKSCPIRWHSKRRPLRYVWRCALSRVLELVRILLAIVLRFAGDSDGNVLAARQTGPLGRKAAKCSATLPRRMDIRDTGLPARICLQPAHGSGTTLRLLTALLAPKHCSVARPITKRPTSSMKNSSSLASAASSMRSTCIRNRAT